MFGPSTVVLPTRSLAASLVMLAAVAPPAAGWEPAQRISSSQTFISGPRLVETPSGGALAGWDFQRGLGNGALTGAQFAGRRDEQWRRPRSLGSAHTPRHVALVDLDGYGSSRVVALVVRSTGADRLSARFSSTAGRAYATQALGRASFISSAQAAFGDDGRAVAVWTARPRRGPTHAMVAHRRVGGRFMPVGAVSRPGADSTAVGSNGRMAVVAWRRRGRLEARISRDGGGTWGRTLLVGRGLGNRASLSVAVSPGGAVGIAWMHQLRSEGGDHGPALLQARLRPPGRGFGDRARLERYESLAPEGGPHAEVGFVDGRGVVAWQGLARVGGPDDPDLRVFAVRSAALTASGLGPVTTLSDSGDSARFEDLAAGGDAVAVSWRAGSGDDALGQVQAAVGHVADGTEWEAAETVSPAGQPAGESQLAWDAGGRLRAVWRAGRGAGRGEAVYAARR